MNPTFFLCTLAVIISSCLIQATLSTNPHPNDLQPRYYYSYKYSWSSNGGDSGGNDDSKSRSRSTQYKNNNNRHGKPGSSKNNGYSGTQDKGRLVFQFDNGQCTDWADARYAQLTGHHVSWSGDARTWANKARNTPGWSVSTRPIKPSIIVLQPGVQGAGGAGHVAVVESIKSNGEVYTSNYNYNGGPYVKTYTTFESGYGISYIWYK
ncbi:hypothetical protein K493DRAFT_380717, partial [Basidiobolus meristosporus CBS 931.73]